MPICVILRNNTPEAKAVRILFYGAGENGENIAYNLNELRYKYVAIAIVIEFSS